MDTKDLKVGDLIWYPFGHDIYKCRVIAIDGENVLLSIALGIRTVMDDSRTWFFIRHSWFGL